MYAIQGLLKYKSERKDIQNFHNCPLYWVGDCWGVSIKLGSTVLSEHLLSVTMNIRITWYCKAWWKKTLRSSQDLSMFLQTEHIDRVQFPGWISLF